MGQTEFFLTIKSL